MEYKELGKTKIKVSQIALGCEGLIDKSQDEVVEFIEQAQKWGINFIDLYSPHPVMRRYLGQAIKNRHEWIIESHLCSVWENDQYLRTRDIEKVKRGFEDTLEQLQTDYVDIGMIHYVDAMKDYEDVFHGEIIEFVKELKEQGKIKLIGMSSHNPEVALKAVKTGLVDVLLFSINPCYDMLPPSEDVDDLFEKESYKNPLQNIDPIRQKLYEYCEANHISITVMKAFGGGDLLDEKLSPFQVKMTVPQCIHYCLTRPGVVSVMAGAHSIEEMRLSVSYYDVIPQERDYAEILANVPYHSFVGHCVYCGHCAPCSQKIDIASVNKFLDLCIAQGKVVETAREHYQSLEHYASECIECGACMRNCPFGVDVISKMKQAVHIFGK
jgi:Predicted oxidoreductases of the aldo/keto reductase family